MDFSRLLWRFFSLFDVLKDMLTPFRSSSKTFVGRIGRISGYGTRRNGNVCIIGSSKSFSSRKYLSIGQRKASSKAAPQSPVHPGGVSFHKRQLPSSLIAMSSPIGKELFREAMATGGMECFFPLSEQFVTQSEPSFCSLSTLAMVLNALNYDPGKTWKGPWRWISEETLQCDSQHICGHSVERVKKDGMNFIEFETLARCHGVRILSQRADTEEHDRNCTGGLIQFRECVIRSAQSPSADMFIVVNFDRKELQQTGSGHFSPIGGYHAARDLVLILDVARFKYPPFWVPLTHLWSSMAKIDEQTGEPRGYFVITTWSSVHRSVNHHLDGQSHHSSSSGIGHNCQQSGGFGSQNHAMLQVSHATDTHFQASCPALIRTWTDTKIRKDKCCTIKERS